MHIMVRDKRTGVEEWLRRLTLVFSGPDPYRRIIQLLVAVRKDPGGPLAEADRLVHQRRLRKEAPQQPPVECLAGGDRPADHHRGKRAAASGETREELARARSGTMARLGAKVRWKLAFSAVSTTSPASARRMPVTAQRRSPSPAPAPRSPAQTTRMRAGSSFADAYRWPRRLSK